MTAEIKTEILIKASVEKVWAILTNFEQYPNWNPFIKSIQGEAKLDNKLIVRIEPPEANGMTFTPKILSCEINKELSWIGHLFFAGLFDGEHKFELIDTKNGWLCFKHSEKFKGILVPLFKKQLHNNTKRGFDEMNKKLKEMAEQK